MQFVVIALIFATIIVEFLGETGILPKAVSFAPELLGGIALLYVIVEGSRTRFRYVRGVYWLVFGAFGMHALFGLLVNNVEPGPIIMGLRYFLRAISLFFLPAIFSFNDEQIKTQFRWILALSFLQAPLAIYQSTLPDVTGDAISGTLLQTGFLSPFLVCVGCMLTALWIRKQIAFGSYVVMLLVVLLPTAINETKVTLLILPIGMMAVLSLGAPRGMRLRYMGMAAAFCAALLTIFVSVYTYTQRDAPVKVDLSTFFTEGTYKTYLDNDTGLGEVGIGEANYIGRVNQLIVPLKFVARDPVTLWFGLGLGNASLTPLGPQYNGQYGLLFENFMALTATRLILETGIGGLAISLLLMWLVYRDARVVSDHDDGFRSAIAAGWVGISAVMVITVFYSDTVVCSVLSYLYWYLSGFVAAERMRCAMSFAAKNSNLEAISVRTNHRAHVHRWST